MNITEAEKSIKQSGTLDARTLKIMWPLGTIIFTDQWNAIQFLITKYNFTFAYIGD